MNKNLFFICAVSLFLTVSCAHKDKKSGELNAKDAAAKAAALKAANLEKESKSIAYSCLVGKDIRTVKVDKKPERCEVHYTKFGETSQVAWAQATPDICSRVTDQIRTNIEGKGFKCDSDQAKLTTPERESASTK